MSKYLKIIRALWARYPARISAIIASGVVLLAARLHVVLAHETVAGYVLMVVPILLGGEATHRRVKPVSSKG